MAPRTSGHRVVRCFELEGAGHQLMIDQPDSFNDIVLKAIHDDEVAEGMRPYKVGEQGHSPRTTADASATYNRITDPLRSWKRRVVRVLEPWLAGYDQEDGGRRHEERARHVRSVRGGIRRGDRH